MLGHLGVHMRMRNKGSLFLCFSMRLLGEDDCEKGGGLSHLRSTCNIIDI